MYKYSFIIPVYNRPDEVNELLESLTHLKSNLFEIILIEDGSTRSCKEIANKYSNKLSTQYHYQENTGPGPARNYGAKFAKGEILIFLDSDCIVPKDYLFHVETYLNQNNPDCFGGPDRSHVSFNVIQKAINYAMTSTLTTGGIRGGNKRMDKFFPRSFNLGVKKNVFEHINGFSEMRFGEDIDFSYRLIENNFTTELISDAWVYHKRRNNFKSFFKQIYNSGIARINLTFRHPGTLKAVHCLPALFSLTIGILLVLSIIYPLVIILTLIPALLFFIDSLIINKSIKTAYFSIIATYIQLNAYGIGFIHALIKRKFIAKKEFHSFKNNFYK